MADLNLTAAIDPELIEAAARAMFAKTSGARMYYNPPTWEEITEGNKESWRYSAQVALEAAVEPLFRQWTAEVFVPVVKEHKHPPESCPCCQMAVAANARGEGGA